jgi:hypothetical protein
MNGVQSFLAIGAISFLTLTSLSFNSSLLESSTSEVENKVYLTAFSLADDLLEEIKEKEYDEKTLVFPTTNRNNLTFPANFDDGENYENYDDIDDFNTYSRDIEAPYVEKYHVSSVVYYVQEDNPNILSTNPTFHKRVDVTVSSPYMRDNNFVVLSFIFTHK